MVSKADIFYVRAAQLQQEQTRANLLTVEIVNWS